MFQTTNKKTNTKAILRVDATRRFEICSQSCSLFDSSVVQAMAGAQQQSLQMSTIPKAWQ